MVYALQVGFDPLAVLRWGLTGGANTASQSGTTVGEPALEVERVQVDHLDAIARKLMFGAAKALARPW